MKNDNLKFLREMYPKGTKVQLDFMDDIQAPHIGSIGIVECVDDACQIHVKWENGSRLALISECDKFHIVK